MENQQPYHFKLVFGNDKLRGEGYSLNLVVRKDGLRRMVATGFYAFPNQWDKVNEVFITDNRVKDLHPERKEINEWLLVKKVELKEIKDTFEAKKIAWTADMFMNTFTFQRISENVFDYFQSQVNTLLESKHYGLAKQYYWTCHMMLKFDPALLKRVWSEIDYTYVKRFDFNMETKGNKGKGCKGNTRLYYHKGLRAVYNKAIKDKVAIDDVYPYGKNGFSASELEEDTPKRYIKTTDFAKIKEEEATNEFREKARKIFLFCYYCYGMSIRDAALLKKENILSLEDGDYIKYKRIKTKNNKKAKPIFIKINDNIREILTWFKENTILVGDYLIPGVSINYEDESLKLYNHITYRIKRINTLLKGIANDLQIDMNITTHVNRHTAAMRLQDMNVPRDIITEMFGHMDSKTTETYLDSFDHAVTAAAGDVL